MYSVALFESVIHELGFFHWSTLSHVTLLSNQKA